ncbi:YlmC/YmxH family sporulation protein [Clostridium sp.]|uniref:YlmC/YmxH family sporulation protein n=1 Tax=Clostridium sp. TaxID=1506 RepID=UPI001A3B7CDB|nr:YlmC/YmxH family sporulation protein [Clostridium sp.]MBK5242822.1 YlmC/YmxH family sporulation protein [Clostridium sp.]
MEDNVKLYSEMERYEIININDGDKYNNLGNNDVVIDENGVLQFLIINEGSSKFSFFHNSDTIEISWEHVKKIGSRTIIIDADNEILKKSRI